MPYLRNKRTGETVFVPDLPGASPVGPQDPAAPVELAGKRATTARTQQQIQQGDALFESEKRLKEAQATIEETKAKAAAKESQNGGLDKQKLANIRAAQAQIDRLRRLYSQGPGKTSGLSSVLDYLPTAQNKQFDTAGAGLGEVGLAAFRVPGVGSQSDTELRAFIDANRPSASDYDVAIQEKLNNLQNRLNQTYSSYGLKRKGGDDSGWKIERIGD